MTEKRKLIDDAGRGPPGLDRITPEIAELIGEAMLHDFAWVGRQGVEVHTNSSGVYVTGIDGVSTHNDAPSYCHDAHARELWSGSYGDAFALIDHMLDDWREDQGMPTPTDVEIAPILSEGSPHGHTRNPGTEPRHMDDDELVEELERMERHEEAGVLTDDQRTHLHALREEEINRDGVGREYERHETEEQE